MEQPAFSVGCSTSTCCISRPSATVMTTVLTWTVYPVTLTRHSCALKANTRYGSKDSTQTGPVLVLCESKTAQTCHIPWASTADACPGQSIRGTRDKHVYYATTQKFCALCSSIIVWRKKLIIYGHACSVPQVKI